MEVKFKDTFLESLEKMIKRERWYWKAFDFLRYDLPRFFRNIWIFRKALLNHRWYSGHYTVFYFTETALIDISKNIDERGNEIRSSSEKKVAKMRRAIEILRHFRNSDFIELAEKNLGIELHCNMEFEENENGTYSMVDNESEDEKLQRRKVYDLANKLEEDMFNELWEIFKGQDFEKFESAPEELDHNEAYEHWQKQFDGSGIRGWWD